MRPVLAAVLVMCAAPAEPAAWPRGEGAVFLSLKAASQVDRTLLSLGEISRQDRLQAYVEWGAGPRLTFGAEVARSGPEMAPVSEWRGFARYALATGEPWAVSAEIGVGRRSNDFEYEEGFVRPGLAVGRGFESRWGSGWAELEAAAEIYDTGADPALKLDVTAGLDLSGRLAVILQARAGEYPGVDPYLRLAPSVVWRLTPRLRLQAEVEAGVVGTYDLGGGVALWVDF